MLKKYLILLFTGTTWRVGVAYLSVSWKQVPLNHSQQPEHSAAHISQIEK